VAVMIGAVLGHVQGEREYRRRMIVTNRLTAKGVIVLPKTQPAEYRLAAIRLFAPWGAGLGVIGGFCNFVRRRQQELSAVVETLSVVEPLPRSVRWFAPWTWTLRKLAFPCLLASWLGAFGIATTIFLVFEETPLPSSPILLWSVEFVYLAAVIWFFAAPVVGLILLLYFVQEYFRPRRNTLSHGEHCQPSTPDSMR